jgi:meso-butanediol dehydrogenase / (S,S)-butanediol dehydrogenase / diacetyl reductase
LVRVADLSKYRKVEALIGMTLKTLGRLHALVNNAGIALVGENHGARSLIGKNVMAVTVSATFHGCRAAMPQLLTSRGCIVNTASVSGLGGDGYERLRRIERGGGQLDSGSRP